jgi:hypothetical protein
MSDVMNSLTKSLSMGISVRFNALLIVSSTRRFQSDSEPLKSRFFIPLIRELIGLIAGETNSKTDIVSHHCATKFGSSSLRKSSGEGGA